ncbi:MAG: thymidine kinase [Flavipsychrobacter sp.]|nr:thymidine kinase [Flavipsychrobacter sp.]
MFIEPHHTGKKGWIEVVCGCMFSGKTEELIRRMKRAHIANQRIEIFKSQVDSRYDKDDIISHDASRIQATAVSNAYNILLMAADVDVVGVDEAQFFDDDIIEVIEELTRQRKRVIVAGLDMDFTGRPFGPMPALLARAEYITKLHAICVCCGDIASYSYRKAKIDDKILLGEKDVYEPRCRSCFYKLKTSAVKQ